jgi:EAL domain-containing protein (putative c-di-GMP-specific phosphodiesterase class I)
MYLAKIAGKNRFHVFDPTLDIKLRSHHANVAQIQRALVNREFLLYYQPKVNMRTGKIVGAEALIRWQHPEKGLLLPAEFLPLIEDHPLAVELGEWVIDSALTQIEIWAAQGCTLPVSVNISARQLKQADFVDRLRILLAAHTKVNPNNLEMEVLETSALDDLIRASDVIEKCRALGVLFALDDFGTGYSSLTYLKRLPVRWLKIDQSFVRDMLDNPDSLSILTGVLSLALALRRVVIAEGVETAAHGAMLLQLGCDLAQGFGIARPMPAGELPNWMMNWRKDPEWNNVPAIVHADLPLLFASAEHKAWVVTIESFLRGERAAPMQLDHHGCRFGAWLDSVSTARHAMQPAIKAIEPLHLQLHELATGLYALHDQNRNEDALAKVDELKELLAAMLNQLKSLEMH